VLATVRSCTYPPGVIDLECVVAAAPATFAHVQQNLATILSELRDAAAYSEIIVVGLYNPLYPAVFQQVLAQTHSPAAAAAAGAQTDALNAQLNSLMASTAQTYRAFFADPLPTFNPPGNPAVEIATICTLTAVCGPLQHIHPTDAGYEELADVVLTASQY
jgi:lysophospholipase L1-like esterase